MQSVAKPTKKCHLCNRQFVKGEHLVRHVRTHTKEKPFVCSICGKVFVRRDTLSRHTKTHHPEVAKATFTVATVDSADVDPTTREIQELVTSPNLDTSHLNPSDGQCEIYFSPQELEKLMASDIRDGTFDFDPKQLTEIFGNGGLDFEGLINDGDSDGGGSGVSPIALRSELPPPPKRKRSSGSSQDIDEQYRQDLAKRFALQGPNESLPSADFMVCCCLDS
jgi:hypothetical protein